MAGNSSCLPWLDDAVFNLPCWFIFNLSPVFFCSRDSPLFDFIESCLRNKHEMVVYEAASAIVNLPGCSAKELAPAVSGYQTFLHPNLTHLCLLGGSGRPWARGSGRKKMPSNKPQSNVKKRNQYLVITCSVPGTVLGPLTCVTFWG